MSSSTIPFKQIRVLSFDIYGTLIDWETGIYTNLLSLPLIGTQLQQLSRRKVLEDFESLERVVQAESPTQRQSLINAEVVRRYAGKILSKSDLDLQENKEVIEKAAVEFGNGIATWPAFEDTVAAIQKLQKKFKLVPLSNIDRASFQKGLEGPLKGCRFDAIYTAEDIGSYKPNPRNFEYLLEHVKKDFGADKDQLCHVAQSLFHDHAPAKAFGITSVWVDRKGFMGARADANGPSKEATADDYGYKLRVDTLAELAEIVDKEMA